MLNHFFVAGMARNSTAESAAQAGQEAARAAREVRTNNVAMEFDIEKLFLITNALWSLLKEQHRYTDEKLMQRINEIDLQDGKLDGKLKAETERPDCSNCGRKVMARQHRCLYCGTPHTPGPFAR